VESTQSESDLCSPVYYLVLNVIIGIRSHCRSGNHFWDSASSFSCWYAWLGKYLSTLQCGKYVLYLRNWVTLKLGHWIDCYFEVPTYSNTLSNTFDNCHDWGTQSEYSTGSRVPSATSLSSSASTFYT